MVTFTDDDLKRFERSFQKTGSNTYGCWEWTAVIGSNGYGRFWCKGKLWLAHRFAWVLAGREIPDGLVMDHLCRNRKCIRIDHLRTITSKENTLIGEGITAQRARRSTCAKNHPWDEQSIVIDKRTGGRQCRICRVAKHKEYLKNHADEIRATRKRRWAERAI